MNIYQYKWLLILCLFLATKTQAQQWKSWGVELSTQAGKIIKHKGGEMEYENSNLSLGWDLNFKYQTYGKKDWERVRRFPELGVAFKYFNYGNPDELGYSLALFPNLTIPFFRKKKTSFHFMLGSGIARLNRHYDKDTNPRNTAIGSTWNNITVFRFTTSYQLHTNWIATGGLGLTHYSNGGTLHPNYGINIVAAVVGLKYTPHPQTFIRETKSTSKLVKKWGVQMHYDMAFREYNRSKKLRPIQIYSLAATYHFSPYNRAMIGVELEKNKGVEELLINEGWETQKAKQESRRYMFFLADEILYGNVGILLQAGAYFKQKEQTLEPVYFKLSARYYLPPIKATQTQFFLGVYLKSHFSVAEYIALGAGVNL